MEDDPEAAGDRRQTQTIQMLREVIDGDPYATVAQRWGLSRSAVDRRIKGSRCSSRRQWASMACRRAAPPS